jgi:tetratricopeptide (TPR) repeat protein
MKKANKLLVAALAAAGVVGVTAGALAPVAAIAAEAAKPKLSASVMKPLKAAQDAMTAKNWDEALVHLKEAQAVQPQTPYDTFMMDEIGWYVLLQKKDYAGAVGALEASVNSGFVPPADLPQRFKALAQLNYQLQNYPKAIEYGNKFLETTPGDRDIGVLVAQGYYLQKDYTSARTAVQKLTAGDAKPSEQLLLINLRCNYELKDRPGTMQAIEALVRHYPSRKYWEDLLTNQLYETKGDRELRNLYRLMDQTNTLDKPEEYSEMATVLFAGGFPAEAAKILDLGMTAKVFTGDTLAREKADLDRARTAAATDSKDLPGAAKALAAAKTGNEMVAIGKLYFSSGDYANASDAIQKGLAKGGVTDTDDANALLGVALVRAGKPADARAPLAAVKDPKYAAIARLWVLYIDSTANAAAEPAAAAPATPPPG